MREIKFRIPMFSDKDHFIDFQYLRLGDDIMGTLCGHNGEPQQYTGLHDKNGEEIYEGDIMEINGERGEVYYDKNNVCYCVRVDVDYNTCIGMYEVIGNIYKNPELIK